MEDSGSMSPGETQQARLRIFAFNQGMECGFLTGLGVAVGMVVTVVTAFLLYYFN